MTVNPPHESFMDNSHIGDEVNATGVQDDVITIGHGTASPQGETRATRLVYSASRWTGVPAVVARSTVNSAPPDGEGA